MAIRVGVIGAGGNGSGHAKAHAASERAELVWVADPEVERAAALGVRALADYRDGLDDVDAVVVASPNWLHLEQATTVARAGKAVWCEKPFGLNLGEARQIHAAISEAGVASQIGFAVRFDPCVQTMLRARDEGRLGTLVSLASRRIFHMGPRANWGWRADPDKTGGLLMEINVHELEWMMAFAGVPTSVVARFWAEDPTHPRANDAVFVMLGFGPNGPTALHEGGWTSTNAQFFRSVQGTELGLATDEWGSKVYASAPGAGREEIPLEPGFDIRANWLDAIEGVAPAVASADWALKVAEVCEACFESARTGRVVDLT